MALSPREKQRLVVALGVTNGDARRIKIGIKEAIRDVGDIAARRHLWCVLTREMKKIIAQDRRRIHGKKAIKITHRQIEDARKHEIFHRMRTRE